MATINLDFLDDCRPDNGALKDALQQICDLAAAPFTVIDPNAGGCGAWGPTATVTEVSYNPATREITIGGQEAHTAYLLSALVDVTFAPAIDISAINTYLGATLNVAFNNPSACDQVLFVGNIYNTNVIELGNNKLHRIELRDITLGAPGPLISDEQYRLDGDNSHTFFQDHSHTIPFNTIVAPSGSFNATYRGEIVTAATAGGSSSIWVQNQIQLIAIGVPI